MRRGAAQHGVINIRDPTLSRIKQTMRVSVAGRRPPIQHKAADSWLKGPGADVGWGDQPQALNAIKTFSTTDSAFTAPQHCSPAGGQRGGGD